MPKVKTIDIKAIFERACGRKIDNSYMGRGTPPISLRPAPKPVAGNINRK